MKSDKDFDFRNDQICTHVRRKLVVLLNPIVEDTKWADDQKGLCIVALTKIGTEGYSLQCLASKSESCITSKGYSNLS